MFTLVWLLISGNMGGLRQLFTFEQSLSLSMNSVRSSPLPLMDYLFIAISLTADLGVLHTYRGGHGLCRFPQLQQVLQLHVV